MATTKIWKIKSRFDNVIDYITNKDKTDNKKYKYLYLKLKYSPYMLNCLIVHKKYTLITNKK